MKTELSEGERDSRTPAIEAAYRRGVHQGIHALKEYLDTPRSLGHEAILEEALNVAAKMRYMKKPFDFYTHELIRRVDEVEVSHRKFYDL